MKTHERGRRGEEIARAWLEGRGFKIVCTNFHCRHGELDIVARDRESLVFVEVKCRRNRQAVVQAIGPKKVRNLKRSALWFLQKQRWTDTDYRFMTLYVIMPVDGSGPVAIDALEEPF